MLAALRAGRFADSAPRIGAALWAGAPIEGPDGAESAAATNQEVAAARTEGEALRRRFGHYLGATLCCGGESYWGLDRLHHLERRLRDEGLCREPALPLIAAPRELRLARWQPDGTARAPVLHWYCSFRSPYTHLSAARVQQLAEHYRAELRIRFVLPMVMRGLPVPREKRRYIVEDCAREARRLGLPFGDIVDPVGKPVERGYAVLHAAIAAGRGMDFALAFLHGVWAEGIDAGSDAGLSRIAARAGFDAGFVQQALAGEAWRAEAEANRAELLAQGLWGVPSFRVDDRPAHWGQDRLWAVEEDLIAARSASGSQASRR